LWCVFGFKRVIAFELDRGAQRLQEMTELLDRLKSEESGERDDS